MIYSVVGIVYPAYSFREGDNHSTPKQIQPSRKVLLLRCGCSAKSIKFSAHAHVCPGPARGRAYSTLTEFGWLH